MSQISKCGRMLVKNCVARGGLCASLLALACGGSGAAADGGEGPLAEPVLQEPPAPAQREEVAPDITPPEPAPEAPAAPASDPPAAADLEETPAPAAQCDQSLSFDDLYAAIDADLRGEGGDGAFLRYVSLSHRLNQGVCPDDLESDRHALVKAINSLSTEVNIAQPEPIDADGVIYRIDLRDLGWDQPTSVDGVAFDDKWEAIIAASPYAVELEGDDADGAKLAAQTAVPVLLLDALIDATSVGDLYYALAGIGENAFDLFAQLGIDFADVDVRAGTTRSRMSQQDTIVQRFDQGNFQGFYWSRFDVADTTAGQTIFSDPLTFPADVISSMYTLPNGLMAYALFDATGARIAETDVLVDQLQRDGLVRNGISCSGCHAAGVNPITDQVRAYVDANRLDFDAATFDDVQETFVPQPELDDVIQRDNAFYQAALARAGLPAGGDPVSAVYQRFDGEVTLAVAAGELGVTASVLERDLLALSNAGDPVLAFLRTGSLRREQFEGAYVETLCALLVTSDNRPVAAECDAAAQ